MNVKFNGMTHVLNCFVLPVSGPAVMRSWWLHQFGVWPLVFPCNDINEVKKIEGTDLHNSIIKKYSKLFSATPGSYNKSKMKIHLKENARALALKCRHMAYGIKRNRTISKLRSPSTGTSERMDHTYRSSVKKTGIFEYAVISKLH